jgi:hypothetical protein
LFLEHSNLYHYCRTHACKLSESQGSLGTFSGGAVTFVFCFSTSAQGRQYSVMAVSKLGSGLEQHSLPPKIKGTSVFLQEVHCIGVSGEALDGIERARLTTIVSSAA